MIWKRKPARLLIVTAALTLVSGGLWAQFNRGRGFGGRDPWRRDYSRENIIVEQTEYGWETKGAKNEWEIDQRFEHDVFRFARVKYTSAGGRRGGNWQTDFPESDLNLPHRLRELTSMEVNPESVIVELTDENLSDYPFLYIVEPGRMWLTDEEVAGLRRYLLNGGFLMVDDFWGPYEWEGFYRNIKRVFPEPQYEPQELPLEHDIFHIVYDLKEKPMIVGIGAWYGGRRGEHGAVEPHYKGIFDEKGRMMAVICHNTDLGDGWEEEGVDPGYFKEHSERFAYPLGINIITYAMTH
ncbi:MAG: DUF4159 domain-containing protein [Planctomycetaceae bacterium]|nr:DUF4159 domain-containing protein [Planctomycetaceae bacterium]